MARRKTQRPAEESKFLTPDTAETARAYDLFFEKLDYTDTCDKCESEAYEHTVSPLKAGGFVATCNICGHTMINS